MNFHCFYRTFNIKTFLPRITTVKCHAFFLFFLAWRDTGTNRVIQRQMRCMLRWSSPLRKTIPNISFCILSFFPIWTRYLIIVNMWLPCCAQMKEKINSEVLYDYWPVTSDPWPVTCILNLPEQRQLGSGMSNSRNVRNQRNQRNHL